MFNIFKKIACSVHNMAIIIYIYLNSYYGAVLQHGNGELQVILITAITQSFRIYRITINVYNSSGKFFAAFSFNFATTGQSLLLRKNHRKVFKKLWNI